MDGFNGISDIGQKDEVKMIIERFKGKLTEMIKKVGGIFDDYSISHSILFGVLN